MSFESLIETLKVNYLKLDTCHLLTDDLFNYNYSKQQQVS